MIVWDHVKLGLFVVDIRSIEVYLRACISVRASITSIKCSCRLFLCLQTATDRYRGLVRVNKLQKHKHNYNSNGVILLRYCICFIYIYIYMFSISLCKRKWPYVCVLIEILFCFCYLRSNECEISEGRKEKKKCKNLTWSSRVISRGSFKCEQR